MTYSLAEPSAKGSLDLLAAVSLDLYLLARTVSGGSPDGRSWERLAGTALRRPELTRRQSAGQLRLWEQPSASGANHELDAAASGPGGAFILEAKASTEAVTKAELSHFHTKTFDFYCAAVRRNGPSRWWPLVASAGQTKRSVRALAAHLGLILVDPSVLPLPILLRVAARPAADEHLPEPLLREAIRLFESSVRSMDQIWTLSACARRFTFSLDRSDAKWIDDLLYVQQELSDALLDHYDRVAPGRLQRRTSSLLRAAAVSELPRRAAA